MTILAHRANTLGPDPTEENTLDACTAALSDGFGLEIDVRRDNQGRFLISHDLAEWTPANSLDAFTQAFAMFPQRVVAVNVKELGYLQSLAALLANGVFGEAAFLFDFELLEPATPGKAQRAIYSLAAGCTVTLASRLSDRGEPIEQCLAIPAGIVWADEFDRFWLTREHINAAHAAARRVYAVSPELHGFDLAARLARWADFRSWRVDGVCTDFACEAQAFFND